MNRNLMGIGSTIRTAFGSDRRDPDRDEARVAIGQNSARMASNDPDVRLMLRVREGDPTAFGELVARFQNRLVGILNHILGSNEEAEDLAQEVFLRVYRHRAKYTPKARFSTWLFTIANNLALNALRDRRRRPRRTIETTDSGPLGPRPEEQLVESRDPTASQAMQHRELARKVREALDTLNERQKMAVVLNKFEEMGYAEIAEVMGLSTEAVKSLLSRARARLREALAPFLGVDAGADAGQTAEDGRDEG